MSNSTKLRVTKEQARQVAQNVVNGDVDLDCVPISFWNAIAEELCVHFKAARARGQCISRLQAMRNSFKKRARQLGCPEDESAESWALAEITRLRQAKDEN